MFPFPAREARGWTEPRALVVVVDPDNRPQPPKDLLRNLFGLTNGEAGIALRVANGQGLTPISEELSVSIATVKTHLQHVFDKTDTHRQAELIRLLTVDRGPPLQRMRAHQLRGRGKHPSAARNTRSV